MQHKIKDGANYIPENCVQHIAFADLRGLLE